MKQILGCILKFIASCSTSSSKFYSCVPKKLENKSYLFTIGYHIFFIINNSDLGNRQNVSAARAQFRRCCVVATLHAPVESRRDCDLLCFVFNVRHLRPRLFNQIDILFCHLDYKISELNAFQQRNFIFLLYKRLHFFFASLV